MQYLGDPRPQFVAWLAKAVNNLAEMRFVNSEHFCHSVLTKPAGVDPQLQIRIDITMNCHWKMTQSFVFALVPNARQNGTSSGSCANTVPKLLNHVSPTFCCTWRQDNRILPTYLLPLFPKSRKGTESCSCASLLLKSPTERTLRLSRRQCTKSGHHASIC